MNLTQRNLEKNWFILHTLNIIFLSPRMDLVAWLVHCPNYRTDHRRQDEADRLVYIRSSSPPIEEPAH